MYCIVCVFPSPYEDPDARSRFHIIQDWIRYLDTTLVPRNQTIYLISRFGFVRKLMVTREPRPHNTSVFPQEFVGGLAVAFRISKQISCTMTKQEHVAWTREYMKFDTGTAK
jgi:hypothetical protein